MTIPNDTQKHHSKLLF